MTEPQKENWQQVIAEIVRAGVSLHKIAVMMGSNVQYQQVKRWSKGGGRGPLHYEGSKLLAIHAEYVPRGT